MPEAHEAHEATEAHETKPISSLQQANWRKEKVDEILQQLEDHAISRAAALDLITPMLRVFGDA